MNRRGFLKLFAGLAVAETISKTYFLPPIGGWKSDVIAGPEAYDYIFKYRNLVDGGKLQIYKGRQIGMTTMYRQHIAFQLYKHGDLSRKQLFDVLDT